MKHGDRRRVQILEAGLQLWQTGPAAVSARQIAKMLSITHTAVLYHWKTSDALKDAIAQFAVEQRDLIVVPMLIASRHTAAQALSEADRIEFLSQL